VTAVAATPVFIFMFALPPLLLAAVQDTSAHVTVGMVSQQFAMLSTEVAPAAAATFDIIARLPVPQKAGLAVYIALHVTGVAAVQQASDPVYVAVATPFARPCSAQLQPAEYAEHAKSSCINGQFTANPVEICEPRITKMRAEAEAMVLPAADPMEIRKAKIARVRGRAEAIVLPAVTPSA